MTISLPRLLTIAGSDSGGGAGIQADLKTFAALETFGMSAITAITAQNTVEVTAVHAVPAEVVGAQIDAVFTDLGVDAVKIGMLSSSELARTVAAALLDDTAVETLKAEILPLATVLTPNLPEAERLTGVPLTGSPDLESRLRAARDLALLSRAGILIKGGHADGEQVEDLLWVDDEPHIYRHPRIRSTSTHGTGCTLSSAIAARLGHGDDLLTAVPSAIDYLQGAIRHAVPLGRGHGPLNHLHCLHS